MNLGVLLLKVKALIGHLVDTDMRLDVDDVLTRIRGVFPDAEVVCEDTFERQRIEKDNIIEEYRNQGKPVPAAEAILKDIENKRRLHGKAKEILIPYCDVNVLGHVTELVLGFYSRLAFSAEVRAKLESIYRDLGLNFRETDAHIPYVSMKILERE